MKVLFAASEAHPLIKTGGLADVSGSLPVALKNLGHEVRLLLPAYRDALARAESCKEIARFAVPGAASTARLLETRLPGTRLKTWLVDYPPAFDRPGNPYLDEAGKPWADNAERYALFSRACALIAQDHVGLKWRADVVHCNDWQTGLTPALLSIEHPRPATVFTIHNLSYQGLFPHGTFTALGLPPHLWSPEGLEFFGRLSFIKGGLAYADWITTVSPTYAEEIQHPELGYGLDGLLRHRSARLRGILNGVDYTVWDPAKDPLLVKPYGARTFKDKLASKRALLKELRLPYKAGIPLFGVVSRLIEQKGVDLLLQALPRLMEMPLQIVVLGAGERAFELALMDWAQRHARQMAVQIGYDERLSHRIEAGADVFLMPSRFEPCGLNQLYSLRYGTPPVVHRAGGLADSVVDATAENLAARTATGIVFDQPDADALVQAVARALALYKDAAVWKALALTGMRQKFDWGQSARQYLEIYEAARIAAAKPAT